MLLGGLSALGGIFGRRKQKYMDPAMYNQMFGAKAIGSRTQELVNQIINSPYGQKLMQGAAEQGQSLQGNIARSAAEAGFGPTGGAQSGASDFAAAGAPNAVGALQRGVTSNLWQSSLPIAQGMVQNEGDLALANLEKQNAEPTMWGKIGNAASAAMAGAQGGSFDWSKLFRRRALGGGMGVSAGGAIPFLGSAGAGGTMEAIQ
jgi:hypothetical protein